MRFAAAVCMTIGIIEWYSNGKKNSMNENFQKISQPILYFIFFSFSVMIVLVDRLNELNV